MIKRHDSRTGAMIPMFAIIMPVVLLFSMIAINLATMQLTRTELKIATDAAARSGGRAWSEFQDVEIARDFAQQAATANSVAGVPLDLDLETSPNEIVFGKSLRDVNGRYNYRDLTQQEIDNNEPLSAIRVTATHQTPLLFTVGTRGNFNPVEITVASQIDRDIALVIDRSGSMAYFKDEDFLYDFITEIYEDDDNDISRSDYIDAVTDYQPIRSLARLRLADRRYSDSVLEHLSGDLLEYALTVNSDYQGRVRAPRQSRWALLEEATEIFFDVLNNSDQEEQVSVTSFASSTQNETALSQDLDVSEERIAAMYPEGSTRIGDGILEAVDTLLTDASRDSAIQTIIVFTDGENKAGTSPVQAGRIIKEQYPNIVIHTVTFLSGSDQSEMRELAEIGDGKHYHAENGDELIEVFRTLAASFRTIITE